MASSIVLVGQRGSGLSSFAVIAGQLTGFDVVDVDARFVLEHASSRAACLRAWGEKRYRQVADRFFQGLLASHDRRHVLVSASHAVDPSLHSLLRRCSPDTPVVMVNRDMGAVLHHLGLAESDQVTRILHSSQLLCRQASDAEFYNLAEERGPQSASELIFGALRSGQSPKRCARALQRVTQDVARFLSLLGYRVDNNDHSLKLDVIQTCEFPSFTTCYFQDVLQMPSSVSEVDCSSDALELSIPCSEVQPLENGAIELISEAFQVLRRYNSRPVIYHVDLDPTTANEKKRYMELCRHGLRLLPEYVTVNLQCSDHDIAALVATSRKCTRVIAHRTIFASEDFSWGHPSLLEQCRRATALGCHHIRFLRFARSPAEDRDCVSFQVLANASSDIGVSAICIDEYARSSAVNSLGLVPVKQPHAPFSAGEGFLTSVRELNRARFSSFMFQPLHFHVFGASVSYSMSPAMHKAAFEHFGLQHSYFHSQSSSLGNLPPLFDDTFGGASISLPFKSQVIDFLDSISEPARIIQAVNTVLPSRKANQQPMLTPQSSASNRQKNRAGKITALHGENTDWAAMRSCIRRQLSAANSVTSLTTALVVGAGGMARAAVYALMSLGVKKIMIWNRTLSRAEELVDHFERYVESRGLSRLAPHLKGIKCRFRILQSLTDPWPSEEKQPSIIICTPPAHAIGNNPGLDFRVPEQWFGSTTGGVVVELSYQSKSTSLLKQAYDAAHRGWVVVEPLEILIEQGCAQFELFVGQPAPRKTMTHSVIEKYLKS